MKVGGKLEKPGRYVLTSPAEVLGKTDRHSPPIPQIASELGLVELRHGDCKFKAKLVNQLRSCLKSKKMVETITQWENAHLPCTGSKA